MAKHPCECFGHRTLEEKPGGTYQICPVCYWEDAPFADDLTCERFSNGVSLRQAQRNFVELGAVSSDFINDVRSASLAEPRDGDWQTIDERAALEKKAVLDCIARSFHKVSRDGGVSLHETEGIDDYLGDEAIRNLRKKDIDRHWQDVPPDHLADADVGSALCFFDPIGWRYYLPAYMTWWLTGGEQSNSHASESLLYTLQLEESRSNGLREHSLERYEMLTREQAEAVNRFLHWVQNFASDEMYGKRDAKIALDSYWKKFDT